MVMCKNTECLLTEFYITGADDAPAASLNTFLIRHTVWYVCVYSEIHKSLDSQMHIHYKNIWLSFPVTTALYSSVFLFPYQFYSLHISDPSKKQNKPW